MLLFWPHGAFIPPLLTAMPARYTWTIYAERLVTLARIYSFWKETSKLQRVQSRRYL